MWLWGTSRALISGRRSGAQMGLLSLVDEPEDPTHSISPASRSEVFKSTRRSYFFVGILTFFPKRDQKETKKRPKKWPWRKVLRRNLFGGLGFGVRRKDPSEASLWQAPLSSTTKRKIVPSDDNSVVVFRQRTLMTHITPFPVEVAARCSFFGHFFCRRCKQEGDLFRIQTVRSRWNAQSSRHFFAIFLW